MATPLERFFEVAWDAFLDGNGLDGPELQDAIKKAGLGEWHEATQEDVDTGVEADVGDPILKLTDAGKDAVRAARGQTSEHERLRAFALGIIGDSYSWRTGADEGSRALLALSGCTDDAWVDYQDVTGATEGQWFVWRQPDEQLGGIMHVDRAIVTADGKIEGKYSCGLDFYCECQPCRFADDVKAALVKAEQLPGEGE